MARMAVADGEREQPEEVSGDLMGGLINEAKQCAHMQR